MGHQSQSDSNTCTNGNCQDISGDWEDCGTNRGTNRAGNYDGDHSAETINGASNFTRGGDLKRLPCSTRLFARPYRLSPCDSSDQRIGDWTDHLSNMQRNKGGLPFSSIRTSQRSDYRNRCCVAYLPPPNFSANFVNSTGRTHLLDSLSAKFLSISRY